MSHDREREVLAKIQKAHRTMEFLAKRSGNVRTPVRDLEKSIALAERYFVNKGNKYLPPFVLGRVSR